MSYDEIQAIVSTGQNLLKDKLAEKKAEVRSRMESMATSAGFSLSELFGRGKRRGGLPVQFRNPDNVRETWTGYGRQPNWLKEALKKNPDMDAYRV
jgi:DNA-binding protein H-NS